MMSWKITKKLKETHLAPLANPFSRSSSTSTITPQEEKQDHPSPGPTTTSSANASTSDVNGIAYSEAQAAPPQPPLKPGILVVTLHEGKGFKLTEDQERVFAQPPEQFNAQNGRPNSASLAQVSVSSANNSFGGRPKSSAAGLNSAPTIHGRYSSRHLPYALVEFDKQQIAVNAVSGTPENPLWAGENTQYKFDVSHITELTLSIYIRHPQAPASAGRVHDLLLGTCKVNPRFEEAQLVAADAKASKKDREKAQQEKQAGQQGVDWVFPNGRAGSLKVGIDFVENKLRSLSMDDFELLKVVGKGSFGKVMQVKKKDTRRIYALKSLRKAHIISRSEVSHTLAERSVLAQINNPFIVPLKFSFQSPEKLYLVLAFVNGGELFHHLQREQRFHPNRARFYAAELLCALECLHGFNVIYRDLKPENILLDYSGHIALCDFGLCKLDMKDEDRTKTFCGTPEYLAPELLKPETGGYTKVVDWWTLGVLLYEMLTGLPPFYDEDTLVMYEKIADREGKYRKPNFDAHRHYLPEDAIDLLSKLLDKDPETRLGRNGAAEIKAHPFFARIDWRKLLQRKYEPLFKPNVADQLDTGNFDKEFTSEAPTDSYVDGPLLSQTMQQQFAGWSYNRPVAGLGDAGGSVKDPSFGSVTQQ